MDVFYRDDYVLLYHGNCLEVMDELIEQGIKVDLILTDPPYNKIPAKWDNIIPVDEMWERLKVLIKDEGSIVLFSSQPFTSMLVQSNFDWFKYEWIWEKSRALGFVHCKNAPMKQHENIVVFSKGKIKHIGQPNRMNYFPQGLIPYGKLVDGHKSCKADMEGHRLGRPSNKEYIQEYTNYPTSILKFKNEGKTVHPTQKPLALCEYLIKTYTNEEEVILDFTCGSGTTLIAAKNLNRKCIGIEIEEKYCEVAKNRLLQNIS